MYEPKSISDMPLLQLKAVDTQGVSRDLVNSKKSGKIPKLIQI